MTDGTVSARCKFLVKNLAVAAALWALPAAAQTPAPEPPPPPAAPPPAAVPPVAAPAPLPVLVTDAKPPTATETMPATRPDALPPIDVGAWVRVGGMFQGEDKSKLNDWHMDNAYVELHAGGKIHKNVGVTLNLNANMLIFPDSNGQGGTPIFVEDAIVSFDLMDEFHLWAGHLLVPVDRANASGPFFMIPWNYPGFFAAIGAPKEGPSGRNNGAVVWGDIAGGMVTYLAGVFDDAISGVPAPPRATVQGSPLFSGRLRLALLDPEPGFWGNASYFGDKDLLSIGIGGQFQKHGSGTPAVKAMPAAMPPVVAVDAVDKDYAEVNVDVLFEKKIPGGSWFTAEGAYYHFNVLSGGVSDSLYGLLAYATPTMGVGNLQPMVRYQWEKLKDNTGTNPWNLDAALSYLIKGPALRVNATYSYTKIGDTTVNSIQLGAQAIFF